jgi:2-polyprenyl-6-methoxyphenol hydroxylase-like FAD-dependent oxidoreductase
MRIYQSIGLAEKLIPNMHVGTARMAEFLNASGKVIFELEGPVDGKSGWASHYFFHQPEVEACLDASARAHHCVEVRNNARVIALDEQDESVTVQIEDPRNGKKSSATAKFIIGADGASGFVRDAAGIVYDDLGFDEEWLVLDIIVNDWSSTDLPDITQQICDPKRPITHVTMPGDRVRWEFRKMPGDTKEHLESPDHIWSILKRWELTPANAEIERGVVYTFRSAIAPEWHKGRLLLVGDACHLTPPFLGQGMNMGIRDSFNLGWKLDLILKGVADINILDHYTPERYPQMRKCIENALAQGKVICETNPLKAAIRNAGLRLMHATGKSPDMTSFPDLLDGILHKDAEGVPQAPAGDLFIQGRVDGEGQADILLDDLIGYGFTLVGNGIDPLAEVDQEDLSFWKSLSGKSTNIGGEFREASGRKAYENWFADNNCVAALMRPDFYLFGTAEKVTDISTLLESLRSQLPCQ